MATNQNNCWTPEADQQLRTLVLDGRSVHAIAARLKRTTGAVKGRAYFLGLSTARDKTVRNERNAGASPADLPMTAGAPRGPVDQATPALTGATAVARCFA